MTYWTWVFFVLTIVGVILNIKKNKLCFVVWAFTNFAWMVVDYKAGIYAQAAKYAVMFVLALWGLYEWRRRYE